MISWWQSIILGIVEGVTEFLPISSTGHLTVVEKLMGLSIDDKGLTAYTAIIQVGAMAAAILYFWRDIVRIVGAWFVGLRNKAARSNPDYTLGWAVIVGFAITAAIALALRKVIEGPSRNLWVVVAGLIAWSLVMFLADRMGKQTRDEETITLKDGIILGLIQSISALVPGVSRSGATISGGLFLGLDRVAATRVSFFLGIPTLLAAGGFEAIQAAGDISAAGGVGWGMTAVGTVISFIVAYASIAWLLKFVASNNFTSFVLYRIVLGLLVGAMLWAGKILAV